MPDVAYATIFLHAATTGLATYVVFASPGVFDQSDFLFFNVRLALLSPLAVDCVEDDPCLDVTVRGGN